MTARRTALVFDLDGTLVDSVYQHVLAWHRALLATGIDLSIWRIHRRIGMSGGLFMRALLREIGRDLDLELVRRLQEGHAAAYKDLAGDVRPLPGAVELLWTLTELGVPWAIATSGRMQTAGSALAKLGVPDGVPIVTRDMVARAKPDPDLFLAAIDRLGVQAADVFVVGDSVWDLLAARRAQTLGIGLLSGGYGTEELESAGAYRVYEDPADLLAHIDEVGGRLDVLDLDAVDLDAPRMRRLVHHLEQLRVDHVALAERLVEVHRAEHGADVRHHEVQDGDLELRHFVRGLRGIQHLEEHDAVHLHHGVVLRDHLLRGHVEDLLHHVHLAADALDVRHEQAEARRQRMRVPAESLDRVLVALRHDAHALHQRDHGERDHHDAEPAQSSHFPTPRLSRVQYTVRTGCAMCRKCAAIRWKSLMGNGKSEERFCATPRCCSDFRFAIPDFRSSERRRPGFPRAFVRSETPASDQKRYTADITTLSTLSDHSAPRSSWKFSPNTVPRPNV